MNSSYAHERAQAHREHADDAQAAWFSAAAERLAIATRAWGTIPPSSRAELEAVGAQVEAVRRGFIELRTMFQK